MQHRSAPENDHAGGVPDSHVTSAQHAEGSSRQSAPRESSLTRTRKFLERVDSLIRDDIRERTSRDKSEESTPTFETLRACRVNRLPRSVSPKKLQEAISTMLREEVADRDETFSSVEHLSAEAVAGYVDGELTLKAQKRARAHLLHCSICRKEVREQREASLTLKQETRNDIHVPSSLVAKLASMNPDTCEEGPAAGDILRSDTLFGRLTSIYWAARRTYKDRTD